MTNNTSSAPQQERPKLRCPGCGAMVELPATICPHCHTDFRTGQILKDETAPAKGKSIIGAVVIIVILLAAGGILFLKSGDPKSTQVVQPETSPAQSDVNEAVESVKSLAEGSQPIKADVTEAGAILNTTRAVADKLEEHNNMGSDPVTTGEEE